MKGADFLKRILCALISALLLFGACLPASALDETQTAGNAVLSAEVPATHRITVQSDQGGTVIYNGEKVTGFDASRLGEPTVTIRAESRYQLKTVTLDEKDITAEVKGGTYTFSPVNKDQTLTVTTETETVDDNATVYTLTGTITKNGKPAAGITLELRSELKTVVTGSDGSFRFEQVPAGHHSLTAIQDGKIAGYVELDLISGKEVSFTLADGIYSVSVPDLTATVNLALELQEDGKIAVTDADAQKAPVISDENSPLTGDGIRVLWIALLSVFSGVSLFALLLVLKKRKGQNSSL